MPSINILSGKSISFEVAETKLEFDGESGVITLQAEIVNQEGYAHPMVGSSNIMTSEDIQNEKTKADLKAMARAALFVGSFIPCVPLQVVCIAGSVALDADDLHNHLQSNEQGAAIEDFVMIGLDVFAVTRVLKSVSGVGRLSKTADTINGLEKLDILPRKIANKLGKGLLEKYKGFTKSSSMITSGHDKLRGVIQSGELLGKKFAQRNPQLLEQLRQGRENIYNFPQNHPVAKMLADESQYIVQNAKETVGNATKVAGEVVRSGPGRAVKISLGGIKVYTDHDETYRKEVEEKIEKMQDDNKED